MTLLYSFRYWFLLFFSPVQQEDARTFQAELRAERAKRDTDMRELERDRRRRQQTVQFAIDPKGTSCRTVECGVE